jgi:hypothetical protein
VEAYLVNETGESAEIFTGKSAPGVKVDVVFISEFPLQETAAGHNPVEPEEGLPAGDTRSQCIHPVCFPDNILWI